MTPPFSRKPKASAVVFPNFSLPTPNFSLVTSHFSLLTSNFSRPTPNAPNSALAVPRSALALVETLIAALILAVLLWLTTGLYQHQLNVARTRQARHMLLTLQDALTAYHQATNTDPPGTLHGAADQAIAALLNHPDSGRHLESLDLALLHMRAGRPRCIDPWGKRLRYISDQIAQPALRRRFQANANKPIFDSAGPDQTFGLPHQPSSADDIRTDEPTP